MTDSPTPRETSLLVLVVEPDERQCEALNRQLQGAGLAVRTFGSAEELLSAQRSTHWGCLVSEVTLPGLSGIELLDALRENGDDMPVLFMTARNDVRTAVRALRRGATDYFEKPLVHRVLIERVRQTLGLGRRPPPADPSPRSSQSRPPH